MSGAVRMRAGSELRAGWRSWAAIAVLIGLLAGPVLAAFAGARRTASVYPRFLHTQRAWDVLVDDLTVFADIFWKPDFDALERLPYIADKVRIVQGELDGLAYTGSLDDRYGRSLNIAKVLEGRLPRPDRADEIAVSTIKTAPPGPHANARVGSTIALTDANHRPISLRVVGRVISPFDLQPNEFKPSAIVSSAFLRRPGLTCAPGDSSCASYSVNGMALRFRLSADRTRFSGDLRTLAGGKAISPVEQVVNEMAVRHSADLQVTALQLMAAFAGLAAALILLQTLARHVALEAADHPTLRALGMSRGQFIAVGGARAGTIGLAGGLLAMLLAILLSPLFPTGVFRSVEPSPGFHFDLLVHVGGPLIAMGLAVAAGIVASAAISLRRSSAPASRTSILADAAARGGLPAPIVSGVRLAFERGRGSTAVPVRATLGAVILGAGALVIALLVSQNISTLLDSPKLYGRTWDRLVSIPEEPGMTSEALRKIGAQPGVAALAGIDTGAPLRLDNKVRVAGIEMTNVKGSMFPPIVEGRAPRNSREILLGGRTLRELGKRVDPAHPETVDIAIEGQPALEGFAIVGRAVIPPVSNYSGFGQGIVLVGDPHESIPGAPFMSDAIVRFEPGTDVKQAVRALLHAVPGLHDGGVLIDKPVDVVNFGNVSNAPVILALLFGIIACAAIAHALFTAIKRRSRDLAILKTLGFVRAQVRGAVAAQATVIVIAALIVAVPLGIIGGRLLWRALADQIGVLPVTRLPILSLLLILPGGILLANLVAALPGRAAARTQAAPTLRTE